MRYLDQALEAYGKSDVYPFHMPGHKRQKTHETGENTGYAGTVEMY